MTWDMLEWGANWLKGMTNDHTAQEITLSWNLGGEEFTLTITGSIVDEAGRVLYSDQKTQIENTLFLIDSVKLVGVPIGRGLRITWSGNNYDCVMQGGRYYFFNDTHRKQTVIVTKNVPN